MMLTKPEQIERYRLATIRAAVKLEALGMTRSGKSATSIAKEILGLPKSTKRETVIHALNLKLNPEGN